MAILKWILLTILSSVVFAVFFKYLYSPVVAYVKSFFIVHKLRNNNHSTRNNLLGLHFADRFLDIWNNGKPTPLKSTNEVYSMSPYWQSRYTKNYIDNNLKDMELIEIYEKNGEQFVKLSNKLMSKFTIKRLNKLVGKNKI
jgi:hypothetical protein